MFIKELKLNVDYFNEQLEEVDRDNAKQCRELTNFAKQLLNGISYYRSISPKVKHSEKFLTQLTIVEDEIKTALSTLSPVLV